MESIRGDSSRWMSFEGGRPCTRRHSAILSARGEGKGGKKEKKGKEKCSRLPFTWTPPMEITQRGAIYRYVACGPRAIICSRGRVDPRVEEEEEARVCGKHGEGRGARFHSPLGQLTWHLSINITLVFRCNRDTCNSILLPTFWRWNRGGALVSDLSRSAGSCREFAMRIPSIERMSRDFFSFSFFFWRKLERIGGRASFVLVERGLKNCPCVIIYEIYKCDILYFARCISKNWYIRCIYFYVSLKYLRYIFFTISF